MHEHDQEMIMALAEGALTPPDAAAATAEIEACAECNRDLELQRVALAALGDAPAVYMSATESARLHEALHRELKIAAPVPIRPQPRVAWGRVAGWAFGAAAVFLGAVLLLPALGGGSNDDASSEINAGAELAEDRVATTVAAFQLMPAAPEAAADAPDDAMVAGEATAESGAATTAAPSMDTLATAADSNYGLQVFTVDLTEELRAGIVDVLRLDVAAYRISDATAKTENPRFATCLEQTMAPGYSTVFFPPVGSEPQLVGLLVSDSNDDSLLVAYVPTDVEDTALAAVTTDTCEVFQTVP
jgi:hypothetical protein